METRVKFTHWNQSYRNKRWSDMPGKDKDLKKLNFFLFRRDMFDPDKRESWDWR